MRIHLRTKRIWKGLIALFITLLIVIFFAAYISAGKETSIKMLYSLSKLEKPTSYGTEFEEALKFVKYGNVGIIYQGMLIITIVMIVITLCTGKKLLEKLIYRNYKKWLINPCLETGLIQAEFVPSDRNILESVNGNVLKLTVDNQKLSGKCNNIEFSQTDVIDVNNDYFGRIINLSGNEDIVDKEINILLFNNVLNNCMSAQETLTSVEAEIIEGFSLYADSEISATKFWDSEFSNKVIELCKLYGGIAIHICNGKITVLYTISRKLFNIELAKRFKYENEMSKIRNDINIIRNTCNLLN